MTEVWGAIGVITALQAGFLLYIATRIDGLNAKIDVLDNRLTARVDGVMTRLDTQSERLDRVIEMLAHHNHT